MKFVVGFNGSDAARRALGLAITQAKHTDALVFVITSMKGHHVNLDAATDKTEADLQWAKDQLLQAHIQCETIQLMRGMSPGEDLVKFAQDNGVDWIFLGVEKKSRTGKLLLGSTCQYVILKGPCPVATTK